MVQFPIEPLLEKPASATLKLEAAQKGNQISMKVSADVEAPGDKIKLRVALIEEWVRYRGRNKPGRVAVPARATPKERAE